MLISHNLPLPPPPAGSPGSTEAYRDRSELRTRQFMYGLLPSNGDWSTVFPQPWLDEYIRYRWTVDLGPSGTGLGGRTSDSEVAILLDVLDICCERARLGGRADEFILNVGRFNHRPVMELRHARATYRIDARDQPRMDYLLSVFERLKVEPRTYRARDCKLSLMQYGAHANGLAREDVLHSIGLILGRVLAPQVRGQ